MKIIISPAKKMKDEVIGVEAVSDPFFIGKSGVLLDYLRSLSLAQLKKLLACNDALALQNFERYAKMDLTGHGEPALLAYDGIQYKYMAPSVFDDEAFAYAQKHLRILSGFYGILCPLDKVTPYRLEMQAKVKTDFCRSLYDFWGDDLYRELTKEDSLILNLASEESSRCISPYLKEGVRMVTCLFAEELEDGTLKEKGVYVKMARGEMVRYLCEQQIADLEGVKKFNGMGYHFDPVHSSDDIFMFTR